MIYLSPSMARRLYIVKHIIVNVSEGRGCSSSPLYSTKAEAEAGAGDVEPSAEQMLTPDGDIHTAATSCSV